MVRWIVDTCGWAPPCFLFEEMSLTLDATVLSPGQTKRALTSIFSIKSKSGQIGFSINIQYSEIDKTLRYVDEKLSVCR